MTEPRYTARQFAYVVRDLDATAHWKGREPVRPLPV